VVLSLAAVVALVAAVLVALGAVAVTRHRAASAADLAALAAAGRVEQGAARACAGARVVATAVGAVLVGCDLVGDTVAVRVEIRPEGALGALGAATGRARAGPSAARP
jgi:secretion/DNA translocation related TadE-like protein